MDTSAISHASEHKPRSKNWRFFLESVRHFWSVGTLTRSSPWLVKSLLADIDFQNARKIVEFGSGSGAVTRELLARMRPDARLYCFEMNKVFYEEIAAIDDPRIFVFNTCACRATEFIDARSVDCLVSGLPMGNFGRQMKLKVLATVQALLKPQGHFSQFQYSLLDYRMMRRSFESVRLGFAPINFPPAFVYNCVKA